MEVAPPTSDSVLVRLGRKQAYRLRRRNYLDLPERLPESQVHILEENERLLSWLRDAQAKHVRLAADFDNHRKRLQREKQNLIHTANEGLVGELLPVIDNFERALVVARTTTDVNMLLSGIEMIYKALMSVLRTAGLQRIETDGAVFDPHFHEALSTEERPDLEDNRITQEILRGYLFRGRVLRPAVVKVNKKKSVATSSLSAAQSTPSHSPARNDTFAKTDKADDISRSTHSDKESGEPEIQEIDDTEEVR
jgi:molecular chaperone GrpE